MWLTHFWRSWSQFFIFAWDVTAGGILRMGVLICLVNICIIFLGHLLLPLLWFYGDDIPTLELSGGKISKSVATRTILSCHYIDVIMTTMASQITSPTVVYSTVYSDADQRKHQSSASLAFVWGIHRDRRIPRTKGQLRGKCFHLMTSSCSDHPKLTIE